MRLSPSWSLFVVALAFGCDGLDLGFGRGAGAFCEGDAACDEGLFCDPADRRCKPFESLGAACTTNSECGSGRCVQGLCCNGPCNSECLSCSLPGTEGVCSVVPEGNDPHGHCPGTAQCGALGRCQGSVQWARAFGDTSDQVALQVAIVSDETGDRVAVAGTFEGKLSIDGQTIEAVGFTPDLFVATFDADGALTWLRTFPSSGTVELAGLASDPRAGLYLAGNHDGVLHTGSSQLVAEGGDAFVIALGPDGASRWTKEIGGPGDQHLAGLAATEAQVVAVGRHRGPLVLDGFAAAGSSSLDAFAIAFELGGPVRGFASYGDDLDQEAVAVAAREGLQAVVAVVGSGTLSFGAENLSGGALDLDSYLAKLDFTSPTPTVVWDLLLGAAGSDQVVSDVALDAAGNAWIAAVTDGPVSSLSVQHFEGIDGFVARLDASSGAPSRQRSLTGPFDDRPRAIAVAPSGEVVVAGSFEVSLDLGQPGTLTAVGAEDLFVIELDPEADLLWATPYGGPLRDAVFGVDIDEAGAVYAVGHFEHDLRLGGEILEGRGERDAFVTRLSR